MKKYLTQTAIGDGKAAEEFILYRTAKGFGITCAKKHDKIVTILFQELENAVYTSPDSILDEIKSRIEKAFPKECENKHILLKYRNTDLRKIETIAATNNFKYEEE